MAGNSDAAYVQVLPKSDRRLEAELRLIFSWVITADGHEPPVRELHDGCVNAGITKAFASGAEVAGSMFDVVVGPGLTAIAADNETDLSGIVGDYQETLAGADEVVAKLAIRLEYSRLGPCRAVVG